MNPDSTEKEETTNDQGIIMIEPKWSPSAEEIVFWGRTGEGTEIFTANADGSDPVSLTFGCF